nr:hypothetical protein Iba_chr07dCG7110 [Ipomoea batatas]
MMHLLRLFLQVDCVTLVATRVSKHSLRIGQRNLQNGLSTIFWLLFVLLSSEMQRDRGGELLMLGRGRASRNAMGSTQMVQVKVNIWITFVQGTPGSLEAGTTWSAKMIGTRGSTSEELYPTRLPNSAALKKTGGSGDTLRSVSAHRRRKASSGVVAKYGSSSKIRLSFPDAILAKQEVVGDEISAVSR